MRASFLLLAAALPLAACPSDSPIEGNDETSGPADTTTTTATTSTPTEASATQIMTTDGTDGTVGTSTGGTTTGEPDPTTETGESTGGLEPIIVVQGLAAPESILHDVVDDVYLISNINGDPVGDDDNGFISRVLPDGSTDPTNWIDGADDTVTLSAPKGMAIQGDVLYVADITQVHKFDRVTGEQLGSIPVPGAIFLNDLAASPLGRVYVSDTMADAIHVIDSSDDMVTELLISPDLGGANGLLFAGEFLLAVGFNANNLLQIPFEGPAANVVFTFDWGQLDGLVTVDDGTLVSSWEGMGVYHLSSDQTTVTPVVEGLGSPADIEVDLGRNVLLVPLLLEDRAEFYQL